MYLKNLISIFLFVFVFALHSISQSDTAIFLKNLINKHTNYKNVNVNFISKSYIDTTAVFYKKVWAFQNNKEFKLRAEVFDYNTNKLLFICLVNEKKMFFINPDSKRSDLFTFNLMKEKELNDFYFQILTDYLPSYLIKEGNNETIINDLIADIRKNENINFEFISNQYINSKLCFGYKITDFDKNNGYIADKSGNSNEKYAEKSVEKVFFFESDSNLIERNFMYFYENPTLIRQSNEKIENIQFNNDLNKNLHLYAINNDTLRNYFKTISKFNGFEIETELADFSIKKAPDFEGISVDNKKFILSENKSKYQLLGFWNIDCEECLIQLNALNEELITNTPKDFSFIAINSNESLDKDLKEFLQNKNFLFPSIFSKSAGEKYLTSKPPFYILLDEKQNIKEIFYELTEDKLNKIFDKLK